MQLKDIAVFGVGGFGRGVLALIENINKEETKYNIRGFFDDGHKKGEIINGYPVLGKTEDLNLLFFQEQDTHLLFLPFCDHHQKNL